ncbi:hypothetical protein MPER_06113 [Moniliophthora perniciosa FA553]|nr:hypothetical protein MPER_06113 [Moniliophthora perniciosa FA553]
MLSIEARQTKIVYSEVKDVKVAENVDLELGMSNLPLACINNALRLDEGAECVERIEVERDAICRAGSSVTTTTTPHLCPLPAREQLIVETEPITGKEPAGANRSQPEVGNVPTEQLYPPKPLLKFGDKKRPNRPKHL